MPKKVLIAVGDKSYTDILKQTFSRHRDHFILSSQEVFHRRFLREIVEHENPDYLIIHDYYLESDFVRPEQKDKELLTFIRNFRIKYEDSLRIVFLCERPKGDTLLSSLAAMGVMDIINTNSFDLDDFIVQLIEKPRFSRVEKFLVPSQQLEPTIEEMHGDDETEEEYKLATDDHKPEKPVVQKVIEKKVVQKVVNKNVIKRDYKIQITNSTEKIVGIPVKKKLIMIGSPISRSGSTFVSHLLARSLTKMGVSATYVESPFSKAYTFDRFIGHHYADDYRSKFYQFSKYIDPKLKSVFDWEKENVDIICKHPTNEPVYKEEDVTFDNLIKVLFSTQSTVTIIDVGTDWHYELFQDVFDIADHAYFVLEPDIPFIQYFEESQAESVQFLRKRLEHEKSFLIGNRFDKSLLKNDLINDLYAERIKTCFPAFSVTDVFQVQLKGLFLNDYKDYQKRIDSYIKPLLQDILPHEFIKKQKNGPGLLKGLFNKKITVEKTEQKGAESTV
ncbi:MULTISPECIES: hypothetical protein [Bacillota]|uniref:hypothetical protein n=1 Tax=Bacillota TaxID=1239 RepID=UPI0039EF23A1